MGVHNGALLLVGLFGVVSGVQVRCGKPADPSANIYQFSFQDVHKNKSISLNEYRGDVALVVNVASF